MDGSDVKRARIDWKNKFSQVLEKIHKSREKNRHLRFQWIHSHRTTTFEDKEEIQSFFEKEILGGRIERRNEEIIENGLEEKEI